MGKNATRAFLADFSIQLDSSLTLPALICMDVCIWWTYFHLIFSFFLLSWCHLYRMYYNVYRISYSLQYVTRRPVKTGRVTRANE